MRNRDQIRTMSALRALIRETAAAGGTSSTSAFGKAGSVEVKKYLKEMATYWKKRDEKTLSNVIYRYYTTSQEDTGLAMTLYKTGNEKLRDDYKKWWQSGINAIEAAAGAAKPAPWKNTSTSPAWEQWTKPSGGKSGGGNFKRYLTFKRGDGLKDFHSNFAKLPQLLKNINSEPTVDKVSFKIGTAFGPSLNHIDNVVIHYKSSEDAAAVERAVAATGFSLVSRSEVGRTDVGVDSEKGESDSQIVADTAAKALLSPDAIKQFSPYLESPEGTYKYEQGLSAIKMWIDAFMQKSSHRAQRK